LKFITFKLISVFEDCDRLQSEPNLVEAKPMQVSLSEAAANLSDLVEAAINGEEVILLNGAHRPAIKFTPIESIKPNRKAGTAKGMIWISDDFDEPLEEFREYME
jgi:antitoxin (DNA-binding transcriptional repressor) of toxin-antitoxin stability system